MLALSMLQYSQIPDFSKTTTRSTFGRNIPWKISDFFTTKNGFEKCILRQIELIRHWNKKINFRTTCLNFKLELQSTSGIEIHFLWAMFTQLHINVPDFMIQRKENKDIKNVVLFNNTKYIYRAYQEYLFQALFFMDFKDWLCRVKSYKYLYPAVNLYWLFCVH